MSYIKQFNEMFGFDDNESKNDYNFHEVFMKSGLMRRKWLNFILEKRNVFENKDGEIEKATMSVYKQFLIDMFFSPMFERRYSELNFEAVPTLYDPESLDNGTTRYQFGTNNPPLSGRWGWIILKNSNYKIVSFKVEAMS